MLEGPPCMNLRLGALLSVRNREPLAKWVHVSQRTHAQQSESIHTNPSALRCSVELPFRTHEQPEQSDAQHLSSGYIQRSHPSQTSGEYRCENGGQRTTEIRGGIQNSGQKS